RHQHTLRTHSTSTPLPYTTLFRSQAEHRAEHRHEYAGVELACVLRGVRERTIDCGSQRRWQVEAPIDLGQAPKLKVQGMDEGGQDRKSTRLNSSHQIISYAVFCLK